VDQPGRIGAQVGAQRAELHDGALPHGDDEVRAGEQADEAGADDLAGGGEPLVLEVLGGADDEEDHVVVALDLHPLLAVQDVLDGEGVQAEHLGDAGERRLGGLVQAEPDEGAVPRPGALVQPGQVRGRAGTLDGDPVDEQAAAHDRGVVGASPPGRPGRLPVASDVHVLLTPGSEPTSAPSRGLGGQLPVGYGLAAAVPRAMKAGRLRVQNDDMHEYFGKNPLQLEPFGPTSIV